MPTYSDFARQTTASELLQKYATSVSDAKKASVIIASQAKPQAQPQAQPLDPYTLAAARQENTGQSIEGEYNKDMRDGTFAENYAKYGAAAYDMARERATASNAYITDKTGTRSLTGALNDTVGAVGSGLANSTLTIGALGLGAVNNDAGVWAADNISRMNSWIAGRESAALSNKRRANAVVNRLDAADSKAQEAEAIASGSSPVLAGLNRIGRDALNVVGRATDDSTLLLDGTANAVGSLLVAGPLGKGIGAIGKLGMVGAAKIGAVKAESQAAQLLSIFGSKAKMPAAIGLMEGGGAYQQTVEQAMQELESRTDLTDAQKAEMANTAGLQAAAIQAPIGAATGLLVSKFEGNPFKVGSLRGAAKSAGRETLEEGTQGATSQLSTNAALQDYINPDQDMAEGVGEQLGLGALYGLGAAVITQAPGVAGRGAKVTGKFAYDNTIGALIVKGSGILGAPDAEAQAQAEATRTAASNRLDATLAGVREAVNSVPDTEPERKDALTTYVDSMTAAMAFDPAELVQQHPYVREALKGSKNKLEALNIAAALALDENAPDATKALAGFYLNDTIQSLNKFIEFDPGDAVSDVVLKTPAGQEFVGLAQNVARLESNPDIQKAIQLAVDKSLIIKPSEVTDVRSEAGQTAARQIIGLAGVAMSAKEDSPNTTSTGALNKIDPDAADTMLGHIEDGSIIVSPAQKAALQGAVALARASNEFNIDMSKLSPTKVDLVSRQIMTDRGNEDSKQISLAVHMSGIISAMAKGDMALASERMVGLNGFARHMANKTAALNQSLSESGKLIPFTGWNPRKQTDYQTNGVRLVANNSKSVAFSQTALAEAKAAVAMNNAMALIYPELKASQIAKPELDPSVSGSPIDVAREFTEGKRKVGTKAKAPAAPTPTPTPTPAPPPVPVDSTDEQTDDTVDENADQQNQTDYSKMDNDFLLTELEMMEKNPTTRKRQITAKNQNKIDEIKKELEKRKVAFPDYAALEKAEVAEQAKKQAKIEEDAKAKEATDTPGTPEYRAKVLAERVAQLKDEELNYRIRNTNANTNPELAEALRKEAEARKKAAETTTETTNKPVAEPEVEQVVEDAPAPVDEPVRTGLAAVYKSLTGGLRNLLVRAFKMPMENPISRLTGEGESIRLILNALKSSDSFREFVGNDKTYFKLTPDVAKAYRTLFGSKMLGAVQAAMNKNLNSALSQVTQGRTLEQYIQDGNPAWEYLRNRALGITENVNGKIEYNQELQEAALLAGLQWLITSEQMFSKPDDEAIAKILGISEYAVNRDHRAFFQSGIYLGDGIDRLGSTIAKFWGVTSDKQAPLGWSKGVPGGVASEVIRAMEEAGLLKVNQIQIGGKTYQNATLFPGDDLTALFTRLAVFPTAIETAVLYEPDEVQFVGSPPTKRPKTQLRNKAAKLTRQQEATWQKAVNTPYYVNKAMLAFVAALGSEAAMELFAYGNLNNQVLNVEHRKSLEGVNLSLASALIATGSLLEAVKAKATVDGTELDAVPIYYDFAFTLVNRLQMLGAQNPQANKLVRELIMPNQSTLDVSEENSNDTGKFLLAVAQAWGIKVHKKYRADSITEVLDNAKNKFPKTMEFFRDWHNKGEATQALSLTPAILDMIKQEMGNGEPVSPLALHAAIEMARYQNASADERKAFKTTMYVEADGVTDGPINALVHLAIGRFTPIWLNTVAKGGLFIGSSPKTVNEHNQTDKADLYEVTKETLKSLLTYTYEDKDGKTQTILNSPNPGQLAKLFNVMDVLIPTLGFDPEKGKITFDRGITKNPLTVTIYGAGKQGIANKISGEIIDELYAIMSKVAQQDPISVFGSMEKYKAFINDFESLSGQRLSGKATDVKLTEGAREILAAGIAELFVVPMQAAIEDTIGDTLQARTALRRAIQVQSIFLQILYDREVDQLIAEKKATAEKTGWKEGDFLSQEEVDGIWDKLKLLSPVVETGTQNIFMGSSERVPYKKARFSSSLTDDLQLPATTYAPENVGVGGIPGTIISVGDGQLIQNTMTAKDAPKGALPIYDGINLNLSTLEADSEMINRSVHEAWLLNPLQNISDTFANFLKTVDLQNIPLKYKEALNKAMKGDGLHLDSMAERLKDLNETLAEMALMSQARKNVMAKVAMSVDHMASAESPFVSKGIDLGNLSPKEQAVEMNSLYETELAKLRKLTDTTNTDIAPEIEQLGHVDEGTMARVIGTAQLQSIIAKLRISRQHKELLAPVIKSLENSGVKVVFGSYDQVSRYAKKLGVLDTSQFGNAKGFYSENAKTVFLINPNSETLLHELLHAATFGKMAAYYSNPSSLSQIDRDAISRIEALMGEWFWSTSAENDGLDGINLSGMNANVKRAHSGVHRAVASALAAGNKAAALNEFLAWVLANPELSLIASKTTVKNKIARIFGEALKALKSLLSGVRNIQVGDDLLSNLRFNTEILIQSAPEGIQMVQDSVLAHSPAWGSSDRLSGLRQAFADKIARYATTIRDPGKMVMLTRSTALASFSAEKISNQLQASGFNMTPQESSTFEMMVTAFQTNAELDPNALGRVQELYAHVIKNLKVEDFMVDPTSTNPNDRVEAQAKWDVIMGNYGLTIDDSGRSTLLPTFLALANTNDEFRAVLAKMPLPKETREKGDTLDEKLSNAGSDAMDWLSQKMSGEGKNQPNIQAAIMALTDRIADIGQESRDFLSLTQTTSAGVSGAIASVNDYVVKQVERLSSKAFDASENLANNTNNKWVKNGAAFVQGLAAIANEQKAEILEKGFMVMLNQGKLPLVMSEFGAELVGRTKSNASVYDMIKLVKAKVEAVRQQFREGLPKIIANKFTRKLTAEEYSHLTKGLARTDIAALRSGMTADQIKEILSSPIQQRQYIRQLENDLSMAYGRNWAQLQQKSKDLAVFMNTRVAPRNLNRNADALAILAGENVTGLPAVTPALTEKIDQLVSHYALQGLEQSTKDVLANLVDTEAEGMNYMMSYLVGQRVGEEQKSASSRARMNRYKGYTPQPAKEGRNLLVADDLDGPRLLQMSYVRVGDYVGSQAEYDQGSKGYYYLPLSARSAYTQGIMQIARQTIGGVDPVSGFTVDGLTAGQIISPQRVRRLQQRLRRAPVGREELMPVFDETGVVIGYERSVDPTQEQRLGRNEHMGEILGIWRGRQAQEYLAQVYNDQLVTHLAEEWEQAGKTNGPLASEFVNLFDRDVLASDPIIADAIKLMPPEMRRHIEDQFGEGQFWVQRTMVNNTIGYRAPSIGDAWTGNSRIHEGTRETVKKLAVGVFGLDAYKYMVQGETVLKNVVTDAKVNIVVKSVIVPAANFAANIYQLIGSGVPLHVIVKEIPRKKAEIYSYVKGRVREIQIEADLRAATGDIRATTRLERELQTVRDAFRRMSIWPLIEAGEFTSISDVGIGMEEIELAEGRLSQYVERLVARLPDGLKTTGRYAIVGKDTALFQGLQRAVQYGDFMAKAIMYDHQTKTKGMKSSEALGFISEEYVNYDYLGGRTKDALEQLGLMWFWRFKVRSAKIAVRMIRQNPVHALMMSFIPSPPLIGNVGSPLSDNIFSVGFDGRLEGSLGPGMGFRAHSLNPWYALGDSIF